MASRRRSLQFLLVFLALFLAGTVVVLSTTSFYLSINSAAYLSEDEVGPPEGDATWNATSDGRVERIPRILHQTWKTETLPEQWIDISRECREMMPDYEYMLWTDAGSREFIAKEYPWFLDTFDSYTYPIQRADAIRYFVLHHYGGVYLDLDVGCKRPLDRLLVYPIILPKTIPVGVSNDLMFAEKGHPFMAQTIHNLVTFDHSWVLNYPTVMFSTGPMFLSAQYGFWTSSHSPTREFPGGEVRILPKSLYGKNAKPGEAPHAFFSHYYGSSWHADDAAFISFLGKWGKILMYVGFVVLVAGIANLLWRRKHKVSERTGRFAGYDVLLPRTYQRNGRWHMDLGPFTLTGRSVASGSSSASSSSSVPSSPCEDEDLPMLPLSFDVRPSTPSPTESNFSSGSRRSGLVGALSRAGSRLISTITGTSTRREHHRSRSMSKRRWGSRGVLFFLPAIFTPNSLNVPPEYTPPLLSRPSSIRSSSLPSLSSSTRLSPGKGSCRDDFDIEVQGASSGLQPAPALTLQDGFLRSPQRTRPSTPTPTALAFGDPPPYPATFESASAAAPSKAWHGAGSWDEWESR